MNRLPDAIIEMLQSMRRSGMSIAQVAAETNVSKVTVHLYTKGLTRDPCGCGKPSGHKGWCPVMLARSPARRALIAAWVPHNKKWTPEARALVFERWEAGVDRDAIAAEVDRLLGTSGTTGHAIMVAANREKARRPKDYLSAMRSGHRHRWWHNRNKWAATATKFDVAITDTDSWHEPAPPAPPNAPVRPVRPAPDTPLATVTAPKRTGFSMGAMAGPDPRADVWAAQKRNASKGVLSSSFGAR
jgi:hypothetical protein